MSSVRQLFVGEGHSKRIANWLTSQRGFSGLHNRRCLTPQIAPWVSLCHPPDELVAAQGEQGCQKRIEGDRFSKWLDLKTYTHFEMVYTRRRFQRLQSIGNTRDPAGREFQFGHGKSESVVRVVGQEIVG